MSDIDVLVVGAGAAGLMAALSAAQAGASVRLLSKGKPNSVEIVGFNVPIGDPADSPQHLFEDSLLAGEFGGHPALVAHMAYGITRVFRRLEAMGLEYRREDGSYPVRLAADSRYPRTLYYLDQTGPRLLSFLRHQVLAHGVQSAPDTTALELLRDEGGAVAGLLCWDGRKRAPVIHRARAVVLAAGGLGQAYGFNTNAPGMTGDSYALAYLAGAELLDMEYVQFEPFIMVAPPAARGYAIPTTVVTNEGAVVTDREGLEPLPRNRDGTLRGVTKWAMSRAMFLRIREGSGTAGGGLWFDCRHMSADVLAGYPRFLHNCEQAGIDLRRDRLEVAPAAHNCMGGVRIDTAGRTSIPGLFACGEAAGGLHGGNRMAGNSGPDCLVFGDTAGTSAAAWAAGRSAAGVPATLPAPAAQGGADPETIRGRLGQLMWEQVGVARTGDGLRAAVEELRDLVRQAWQVTGSNLQATAELRHLTLAGLCVATAASLRAESRGAHFRLDHPLRDDEAFLGSIVLTRGDRPEDVQARWLPLAPSFSPQTGAAKEGAPWLSLF